MSSQSEEELERELLQRVGMFPKKKTSLRESSFENFLDLFSNFIRYSSSLETKDPLLRRIEKLEETVEELKKEKEPKKIPLKADLIYSKFKTCLEKEHFGKIVAMDIESEQIVGMGNSILEAYREAKKNTSKNEFSYRRVGSDYVHRL